MAGKRRSPGRRGLGSWLIRLALAGLAGIGLAGAGCFSPAYQSGSLQCHQGRCQTGYFCAADGRCWKAGDSRAPSLAVPPTPDGGSPADARDNDDGAGEDLAAPPQAGAPSARLASLQVNPGSLRPPFDPQVTSYVVNLPLFSPSLTLRASADDGQASLSIDGSQHAIGSVMNVFSLVPGTKIVRLQVKPQTGPSLSYDLVIAAGSLPGYLKAWHARAGDRFGSGLALGPDTVVVSAPGDRSKAQGIDGDPDQDAGMEVGAVYVLARPVEGLAQPGQPLLVRQAYLKPERALPGMRFGESLALHQDTLVVGAPGEAGIPSAAPGGAEAGVDSVQRPTVPDLGGVYVFVRREGRWTQQAHLRSPEGRAGDRFGSAVAIAGDTLVVGAPGADQGNSADVGSAVAFGRDGEGRWSLQGTLRTTNGKADNGLGSSLAIASSGDLVALGAPGEDGGASGINPGSTSASASDSGAAYLFARSAAGWSQQAYVKSPHTAAGMHFGAKVALAGDLLAISAPGESSAATGIDRDPRQGFAEGSGAVFLYRRAGMGWGAPLYIKGSNAEAGDGFGLSLGLSPTTLVVGAGGEDSSAVGINDRKSDSGHGESGAAYVFRLLPTGNWWEAGYIKSPNSEAGDRFGIATAVLGDTVVVGTDGEDGSARTLDGNQADNAAANSGAVFLY